MASKPKRKYNKKTKVQQKQKQSQSVKITINNSKSASKSKSKSGGGSGRSNVYHFNSYVNPVSQQLPPIIINPPVGNYLGQMPSALGRQRTVYGEVVPDEIPPAIGGERRGGAIPVKRESSLPFVPDERTGFEDFDFYRFPLASEKKKPPDPDFYLPIPETPPTTPPANASLAEKFVSKYQKKSQILKLEKQLGEYGVSKEQIDEEFKSRKADGSVSRRQNLDTYLENLKKGVEKYGQMKPA